MDMTTPSETSPAPQASGGGDSPAAVCPVCRAQVDADATECLHCHVPHHRDCWEYNQGCGTYGCPSAPPTQKLTDVEIPASFWGQDQKECPVCHQMIQAAALRCRACGTVFSTARPQHADEFRHGRDVEA